MIDGFDRSRVRPYLCLLNGEDAVSRSLEPEDCPILRLGVRKLLHLSSIRKAWRSFGSSGITGSTCCRLTSRTAPTWAFQPLAWRECLGWFGPAVTWATGWGRSTAGSADCTTTWWTPRWSTRRMSGRGSFATQRPRPETVVVMENGVDLKRFKSILPLGSVRNFGGPRRVGLVANLRAVKDPELFVRPPSWWQGPTPTSPSRWPVRENCALTCKGWSRSWG